MSDMLAIGQTGIRAYARALDTLADNVANAATPGHVRRTTELVPVNQGGSRGALELDPGGGSGVRLAAIVRAADLLQVDTLRRTEGDAAALEVAGRWLGTIEAALTGPNALDTPLNALFGSLSDLASDPSNPGLGDAVLTRAGMLADQFNRSAAELSRVDEDLLLLSRLEMRSLNDLSQSLADINGRLRRVTSGTAAAAALADVRDRMLASIGAITTINVTLDGTGQARVRIPDAGGPLLVDGSRAVSARVLPSPTGIELRLGPSGGDEPATLVSGALAGLGAARLQLSEARSRLDALAERVAQAFNAAHTQGIDRTGADGTALFEIARPIASSARANGGEARVKATLADGASVIPMTLVFDGTGWTLTRPDTGASVTGPFPLTLDGLSVEVTGEARPGDLFRIEPAGGAAAIRLRDLASAQLATAQRWLSEPASANSGSARLELVTAPPLVPAATGPFSLSLAAGVYSLTDSLGTLLGTGAAGSWIAGDGFAVRASKGGAEGDSHAIVRTGPDSGANGNVLALLAVRDSQGPQGTPGDEADALVSRVATARAAQQARFETARESRNQAAEALSLSSGVDLDTEASEMLRLQQAYSANARVLQAAREIFETLLSSSQ
jgi:flagellar hook-associated protein 1 FlgK